MRPEPHAPPAPHPLMHPVSLGAIALLVLNDHVLKAAYPGFVTGKLSDIAGLVFFPLLLAAAAQTLRPGLPLRPSVLAGAALSALVFASVQVSPLAGAAYRYGLAALQWPWRALVAALAGRAVPGLAPVALTPDLGDLWAIPAVLVAVALAWRAPNRAPKRAPRAPGLRACA